MDRELLSDAVRLSRRQTLMALGLGAAFAGGLRTSAFAAPSGPDWEALSKEFLIDKSLTYLNTGSLGSTPKAVLEARHLIEKRLEGNPVGEGFGPVLAEAEAANAKVAELIGCEPKECTITRNTTEGMNFIAEGVELHAGQRVLTSNNEHGGGLGGWKFLEKYRKVAVDEVAVNSPPRDEDEIVDAFKKGIKPKTRVIMTSCVTFSNGIKMPIARLSELAHKHKCLMVVDGAQSTGGIPVDVKQLGCDAYVSSGHKFVLGPKGTGILYISEKAREHIKPMQLDDGFGFYTAIRGTNCMPEAIGLGGAIDWIKQIGRDAVFARLMSMRNSLYEVLKSTPNVKIDSPPPGSPMASHLVCFSIPDRAKYARLQEQFGKDKIIVKGVGKNGIDHRLSVHLYNTEADIAKFAESLKAAVG